MKTYDWIVVGGGIIGSALSYELARVGFSVLLLERYPTLQDATRYSYGGIAYWSGTTDLTRQLCEEGITLHRNLSAELEGDTQFRELDLLLTIDSDCNPQAIAASYRSFAIPPTLLDVDAACELEPLLNRDAIAGVLQFKHGHVDPVAMVQAYNQAFVRLGGEMQVAAVVGLHKSGDRIQGVITPEATHSAANVIVSAGGMSRKLLQTAGLTVPCYYTHAELIEVPSPPLQLRSLVMPAETKRFDLEAKAGAIATDSLWDEPGHELAPAILDAGAIQFSSGRLLLGQTSHALTNPHAQMDAAQSEAAIRAAVGEILPALKELPGTWQDCLVAFTGDRLPLVGAIPGTEGIHIFSAFSNPFALFPSVARRYAKHLTGHSDPLIPHLSPARFAVS